MSRPVGTVPWERLDSLSLPEDHALVHAWLGQALCAPLPNVHSLLAARPHLSSLRLSARPFPRTSPGAGDLLMRLHLTAGGQVTLRLGGALVQSLLGALGEPPGDPPEPGRLLAPSAPALPVTPAEAGVVAAVVVAALVDLAPGEIALDDVWAPPLPGTPGDVPEECNPDPAATALPAALWCESTWTLGEPPCTNAPGGTLHAFLDARATETLRQCARGCPPPLAAARAARLCLSFDFIAAEARSSAAEAAALRPGDVIAFPHAPPAGAGCVTGCLALEGWRHPARLERTPEGRCLTLFGEECSMSEHACPPSTGGLAAPAPLGPDRPLGGQSAVANAHPADRLDRLPVRISVSLGKVSLSAADVLRLAPGAVIELHEPLGGAVEVLAGGQPLARGELVTVDGALGVRITSLLP